MKKKTKGPGPAAWIRENKWTCIVLAAALAVFAVIGVALLYALDKIKKDNIIETLKRDDI